MNNKLLQREKILAYMDQFGFISVRDMYRIGINGGTARISDLRKLGYNIQDRYIKTGSKTQFKIYFRGPDQYNNYVDPALARIARASDEFI